MDRDKRELALNLSFLGEGKYKMVLYRDCDNAYRIAIDYKKGVKTVNVINKLTIKLAPSGGWVARLIPITRIQQ